MVKYWFNLIQANLKNGLDSFIDFIEEDPQLLLDYDTYVFNILECIQ